MMLGSMEIGSFLRPTPVKRKSHITSPFPSLPISVRASSNLQGGGGAYRGPKPTREWPADWISNNDDTVRSLPIYVGGASLVAVLLNRAISGIAPVADAGSSQSRADLLTLGLAVTNILAGLVWLSIKPKTISMVYPEGVVCQKISPHLPHLAVSEILWVWESLSVATCCRSLVIVYDEKFILQYGYASTSSSDNSEPIYVDVENLMQGSLYQSVLKSGSQSYLANLSLFPAGKPELPFLPSNTQAVILQPLGDRGIAIIGGDTIRGFTSSDQAWISLIGDKLVTTLQSIVMSEEISIRK
ncbi:protein COFACTOR ASSEMBLY OF COMPLEX C SUBUNIT B CCB4, chloroplastic [Impatiens glandulifera]|uniref:protein COFACTOR ASSEMBLY OF COMPLEX C SUBUNIT B CCB4, chloroplastic n=1 Tax=Impatiens glandulifera TaxID=253017 RepID=UPI001FB121F3|nr:protein COFACTOR ASSEMBLY OF COMPLEX C SUBUNIT B CCB4, chloroplastic [Impatiens glandulifera]